MHKEESKAFNRAALIIVIVLVWWQVTDVTTWSVETDLVTMILAIVLPAVVFILRDAREWIGRMNAAKKWEGFLSGEKFRG